MKKVFFILTFMLVNSIALANQTNVNVEAVAPKNYKVTCADGSVYYFQAENMTSAQHIGKIICSTSKKNQSLQSN